MVTVWTPKRRLQVMLEVALLACEALEARGENGPLPGWLTFDRGTGKFTGRPPESLASFAVIVTARDSSGNEVSTRVVLNFTSKGN